MIDPNVEAVSHRPAYRRIDPFHPGRKTVITEMELLNSGTRREPDAAIYQRDFLRCCWILKDGV